MPDSPARPQAKHPPVVIAVFLLLFVGGTTLFFGRNRKGVPITHIGADGRYYWAYLTSLVLDRDLDFTNQYATERSGNFYQYGKTSTGRLANGYAIGPAIAWMPSFLVAHGISLLVESRAESADGNSNLTQQITLYATFLYLFFAMLLVYAAARERWGAGPALVGVIAGMACGPVLSYGINQPHYAHGVSAAAVAALLAVWDLGRNARTLRGWLLLGALVGAAALMRPQNVVYALPVIAEGVLAAWRERFAWRALRGPLFGALVALLVFFPQLLAWHILFGHWLGVPQGSGYLRWGASAWSETLFSSRNGLFPFAPVWLLGMIGVAVGVARTDRSLALKLLGTFALMAYVNGAVWDWWGWGSFGGRRYDGLVFHVAFGVAALAHLFLAWVERRPRVAAGVALGVVAAVAVTCQTSMALDFMSNNSSAQGEWTDTRAYYERMVSRLAQKAWRLGDPLAWPAAWVFALRTGASPSQYDAAVGPQLLDDVTIAYQPHEPTQHAELELADARGEALTAFGLGAADKGGGRPIRGAHARFLVPLNLDCGMEARVLGIAGVEARLEVTWNGDPVASATVEAGGAIDLDFRVPAARVKRGINLLDVRQVGGGVGPGDVTLSKIVLDSPR